MEFHMKLLIFLSNLCMYYRALPNQVVQGGCLILQHCARTVNSAVRRPLKLLKAHAT
jgi:hypothetical protein